LSDAHSYSFDCPPRWRHTLYCRVSARARAYDAFLSCRTHPRHCASGMLQHTRARSGSSPILSENDSEGFSRTFASACHAAALRVFEEINQKHITLSFHHARTHAIWHVLLPSPTAATLFVFVVINGFFVAVVCAQVYGEHASAGLRATVRTFLFSRARARAHYRRYPIFIIIAVAEDCRRRRKPVEPRCTSSKTAVFNGYCAKRILFFVRSFVFFYSFVPFSFLLKYYFDGLLLIQ